MFTHLSAHDTYCGIKNVFPETSSKCFLHVLECFYNQCAVHTRAKIGLKEHSYSYQTIVNRSIVLRNSMPDLHVQRSQAFVNTVQEVCEVLGRTFILGKFKTKACHYHYHCLCASNLSLFDGF